MRRASELELETLEREAARAVPVIAALQAEVATLKAHIEHLRENAGLARQAKKDRHDRHTADIAMLTFTVDSLLAVLTGSAMCLHCGCAYFGEFSCNDCKDANELVKRLKAAK